MRTNKIGFFDSGVGGLTVSEAVRVALPDYDMVYLGDTARAPYGARRHDQLVEFTWQGCLWLFERGCELIIIACNSASAGALREIQQKRLPDYPGKRALGVIRPTVEELSKRGFSNVLVLSTSATQKSQAYPREFAKINPTILVQSHACPRWVALVEAGKAGTQDMRDEVKRELSTLSPLEKNSDAILLACTHYPFIKKDIDHAFDQAVPIFDQGDLVAASLVDYLRRHPEIASGLSRHGQRAYFVTGSAEVAQKTAQDFLGYMVNFRQAKL